MYIIVKVTNGGYQRYDLDVHDTEVSDGNLHVHNALTGGTVAVYPRGQWTGLEFDRGDLGGVPSDVLYRVARNSAEDD